MTKPIRCAAASLVAALTVLPALAVEPTFSCGDAAKVGRGLYDRTKEAHDKRFHAHAEFLAESFWRVAETFSACRDLKKMGGKLAELYPPSTRGRFSADGSTFGATTISGAVGTTRFSDISVEMASKGGTAVISGRTVPGTMFVDGVPFVPATTATASTWTSSPSMKDALKAGAAPARGQKGK